MMAIIAMRLIGHFNSSLLLSWDVKHGAPIMKH
jgi:hypothetical protein